MTDREYEKKWGKGPHVTVDIVLFWNDKVLLIQREDTYWALPGGFVGHAESLSRAANRELKEETDIEWWFGHLNPVVYDDPNRDERSRMITHVFIDEFEYHDDDYGYVPAAGDDAIAAQWMSLKEAHRITLFADHNQILVDAVVARSKK